MESMPPHGRRFSRPSELEDLLETDPPTTALLRLTPEGRAALAALRAAGHPIACDTLFAVDELESEDGP